MPPTDASTHASTDTGTASAPGNEDTLELRLTDDFLALLSEDTDHCGGSTEAAIAFGYEIRWPTKHPPGVLP